MNTASFAIVNQRPEFTDTYPMTIDELLAPAPQITGVKLAAKAKAVASLAHFGQVDAIGAPYYGHLLRTSARATTIVGRMRHGDRLDRHVVEAVAMLHDCCEDTPVTPSQLKTAGFPDAVVNAVTVLTHGQEPRTEYLALITRSLLTTVVKIADTLDNTDVVRQRAISDTARRTRLAAKYHGQLKLLLDATAGDVDPSTF